MVAPQENVNPGQDDRGLRGALEREMVGDTRIELVTPSV